MKQDKVKSKCKIDRVGVTEDTLTGRGGMALFVRYLSKVNIYALLLDSFGYLRRSKKGQPVWNIFKQVFCFFYDGTSRHLVYFDQFKRFCPNMAFFYCMLLSFFLFECFKEDVLGEVLPIESYASTVRRKVLDFAAKVVHTGRGVILKVTQAVWQHLRFEKLWERCQNPIPILGHL
jgi:hypothetical protein